MAEDLHIPQVADLAHIEAASSGLPQLDVNNWVGQIFWLVVSFGLLYLVLSKLILPNLAYGLVARQDRIADDLDMAADLQNEAQAAEKTYTQALEDARRQAHKISEATRLSIEEEIVSETAAADAQAQAHVHTAADEIARMQQQAMSHIDDMVAELSEAIYVSLTGQRPDSATVQALIREG